MSAVTGSLGSARNSSHVHVRTTPPFSIVNVHRSRGVCGVGPAESTGKSRVTDWPGGTRAGTAAVFRRRPRKPRETKLISVSFFLWRSFYGVAHRPTLRYRSDLTVARSSAANS